MPTSASGRMRVWQVARVSAYLGGLERVRGPVVASVVGKTAEAATLVVLATVVPRVLGPADYGRFAVALTVVAIGSVAMTLGGVTLLARYVPAATPALRVATARTLSLRLARNRAAVFLGLVAAGGALTLWDPHRFPPALVALVLVALALNVVATLALQADLALGRAGPWCARYPVHNAVLIAAALVLYATAGSTGAVAAIALAAAAGCGLALGAAVPKLRGRQPMVRLPRGAPRFGALAATGGALTQYLQRGGVLAVALLAGSAVQTGFAALAIGLACAATYAVVQTFTVCLPRLAGEAEVPASGAKAADRAGEAALRRLAAGLLAIVLPAALLVAATLEAVIPTVFGQAYREASAAFAPAVALVVLAPLNALALQVAALRLRPEATVQAAAAGAATFTAAAIVAVPEYGAVGATGAALAGVAASALVAMARLPAAAGARLATASLGGSAAVLLLGMVST